MSGCFDDAVGDAEGSDDSATNNSAYNHPPVISASITSGPGLTEGVDCTTDGVTVEVRHAMTDWDGSIAQAGWDTDLDGAIDYLVTDSEGHTILNFSLDTMTSWDSGSSEYLEKSFVFGAQDDSGSWTSSEIFLIQVGIYSFDNVPCPDFADVTDYNFSVVDHVDIVSTGNGDYLVEITRTNGQNGIEWSRISIIVDGDNEGDTGCTPDSTSTYGCTYQSVGELWESGETIIVKEMNNNLHEGNGYYDIQIIIMIDGVLVDDVDLDLQ